MTGIKILLWVNCYGRLSSMFGLAGTPRQGQRHSMSQTTGAIKGKTDLQCDRPAGVQLPLNIARFV